MSHRKATDDELRGATVLKDEPKRAGRPIKTRLDPKALAKNAAARARYAAKPK